MNRGRGAVLLRLHHGLNCKLLLIIDKQAIKQHIVSFLLSISPSASGQPACILALLPCGRVRPTGALVHTGATPRTCHPGAHRRSGPRCAPPAPGCKWLISKELQPLPMKWANRSAPDATRTWKHPSTDINKVIHRNPGLLPKTLSPQALTAETPKSE